MCQCVTSILQRRWPSLRWRLSVDISSSPSCPSPWSLQVFIRTLALDICRSVVNLYLSPLHWPSPVCDVASGHWKICMVIINSACAWDFQILWLWDERETFYFLFSFKLAKITDIWWFKENIVQPWTLQIFPSGYSSRIIYFYAKNNIFDRRLLFLGKDFPADFFGKYTFSSRCCILCFVKI